MTKSGAIIDLLREMKNIRLTQTSANRVIRACVFLGLNRAETIEILGYLDYCDIDGNPYRDIKLRLPK